MKKFFVSFALFAALVFVISCGGGSKNNDSTDTTDSGETVNDEDAVDTDATDSGSGDNTDSGDSGSGDNTDSTDSGSGDNTDTTDSCALFFTESACAKHGETCLWVHGMCMSYAEECKGYEGATWNASQNKCTRTIDCIVNIDIKQEHTVWNGESSVTQTYNFSDQTWSPELPYTEYSEEAGLCHFKCAEGYLWIAGISECESYAEVCERNEGATWNASQNKCTRTFDCIDKPEHAVWNGENSYTQTLNFADWTWSPEYVSTSAEYSKEAGLCHFKCEEGYLWEGGYECLTYAEVCKMNDGAIWNASQNKCTRTVECPNKAKNSVWNDNGKNGYYTTEYQYKTNSWIPAAIETVYNDDAGECHFKCTEGYYWNANYKHNALLYEPCSKIHTIGNICTGQKECYDESKKTDCPGFLYQDFVGQDAQESTCIERDLQGSQENDQNVVFDYNTGLVWEPSPSGECTWNERDTHCKELRNAKYGGRNDWRVPNTHELLTIVDADKYDPAIDNAFENMPASVSALWANKEKNEEYAFYLELKDGSAANQQKTASAAVLCVSGKELAYATADDFEVSEDEKTVTDKLTGLMWQKGSSDDDMSWKDALKYCQRLNNSAYAGYTDWRLPNKNELASLLNYDKTSDAYSYFPGIQGYEIFWSSSSYIEYVQYVLRAYKAWTMSWDSGTVGSDSKSRGTHLAKCVRNSPELQCNRFGEWNAAEKTCKCSSRYDWTGKECLLICHKVDYYGFDPRKCIDPETGYVWSEIAKHDWSNADLKCKDHKKTTLSHSDYKGWHLPNISELRTLVQNCEGTVTGGACGVVDNTSEICLTSDCYSSACYCAEDEEEKGKYSKFGDKDPLWSSSEFGDDGEVWSLNFHNGETEVVSKDDSQYYRCITRTPLSSCTSAGGIWNQTAETCQCPEGYLWNATESACKPQEP